MNKVAASPFWDEKNDALGTYTDRDDFLHREHRQVETDTALTETHYFAFNVPEHRICGMGWLWHHPNLALATHGTWVWQGIKPHPLQSELFDWVNFESDRYLADDLRHYRFPNSYEVTTLEPLKRHRIQYRDDGRRNSFDIQFEAVMPPAMMKSGQHFEQGMRARGELVLGGRQYAVNCLGIRDRSWGHLRGETLLSGPANTWATAAFGDDFLFTIVAGDAPSLAPAQGRWSGLTDEQVFKHGWVRSDGQTQPVVSCRKVTHRNRDTLLPEGARLEFKDASGRVFEVEGKTLAASKLAVWPNIDCAFGTMEWRCNGRVGHGDFQDLWPPAFVREFLGKATI